MSTLPNHRSDREPISRGKVVGGSSQINGQAFLRGMPDDFEAWAAAGNDQWSYQNLLPSFNRMEADTDFTNDFHGTDGSIYVRRYRRDEWPPAQHAFYNACRDEGFPDAPDFNDPDGRGVGPIPFNNSPNKIRISTAVAHLSQARHRLNLTVRGDCTVQRILFDGTRAIGVEVRSGGERYEIHGGEVVLCAGAISSPHLLLLSGVGPAGHLREFDIPVVKDLPGVGQNLRDHPYGFIRWRTRDDFELKRLSPWYQVALRYTAPESDLRDDLMLMVGSYAARPKYREEEAIGILILFGVYLARGSGEIRLDSPDPEVQPNLNLRLLEHPDDLRRLREAARMSIKLGEHPDFEPIIAELYDPREADLTSDDALDDWLVRSVTSGGHFTSTCKMGPSSDPIAVVDQYGQVHGLEGLRVADASIMPDCVRANTNVTCMVIGERVAELVREGR